VTVIGLGPMGQAMVRAFLAAGHPVTVWNRTAARADELVAAGARRAATVAEAVAANELVVLSLTDYRAMYDILGGPGTPWSAGWSRTSARTRPTSPAGRRRGWASAARSS
jgi:3-hydroxyisobutyrate dehydrogenase-like beta-hydroxyacid dehydrogenase